MKTQKSKLKLLNMISNKQPSQNYKQYSIYKQLMNPSRFFVHPKITKFINHLDHSLFQYFDGKTDPGVGLKHEIKNTLIPNLRKRKRPLPPLVPLSSQSGAIPNMNHHQMFTSLPIIADVIPIITNGSTCSIVELQEELPSENIKVIDIKKDLPVDSSSDNRSDSPLKVEDSSETFVVNFEEKPNKASPVKKPKSKNTIYKCKVCQPNLEFKIW